jgi:hypothetical protein
MFKITHGQNAGQTVSSEDDALALLGPEDLAQGGYVWAGNGAAPESGEFQFPTISPVGFGTSAVNPDGFASMVNRVRRGS